MVPTTIIVALIVLSVVSVLMLVIAWFIVWRRTKAGFVNALIGMAVFTVCYIIAIATSILASAFISNLVVLTLVLSLRAGLVEEFGRFVAFKWLLKKRKTIGDGLMYGVGHGGMEVLLVFSLAVVSSLALALMANSGNLDVMIALAPDQAGALNASVTDLAQSNPLLLSAGLVERIVAMSLHIALSVIVFCAVRQRKWMYLVLAMALHALTDASTALYVSGIVGTWAIEGIIAAITAGVVVIAWRIARSYKPAPEPWVLAPPPAIPSQSV